MDNHQISAIGLRLGKNNNSCETENVSQNSSPSFIGYAGHDSLPSRPHSQAPSRHDSRGTFSVGESEDRDDGEDLLLQLSGMPHSLEKGLMLNQILQQRVGRNIARLESALRINLRHQVINSSYLVAIWYIYLNDFFLLANALRQAKLIS